MTNYGELKRLAEIMLRDEQGECLTDKEVQHFHDSLTAYERLTGPAAILALIAENEHLFKLLERMVGQYVPLTELEEAPGWSRVVELVEAVDQCNQLKTELKALHANCDRARACMGRRAG